MKAEHLSQIQAAVAAVKERKQSADFISLHAEALRHP